MASQLFCLALLVVSAFGAYDVTTRQQYLPLQNYGIYNQVNNPLRQLWWNRQQIWGNTEGLVNSYPEIIDICQRFNVPVQGLAQSIGVNELREINHRLNFLGNTEDLFRSYPEIMEFCQRINMQVQSLAQQTLGVNEIRDVNQRFNFLGNTEGLIRSYPEIVDICQRINMPVQGLTYPTIGVNELREINLRLNILGNTEGLFRSYSEIMGACQRINTLVQGLVQQNFGVNEISDASQRFLGNTEGFIRFYPEVMNVCQRFNLPVQTVGINELREINQRLNFLGNTEGLFRSYPEITDFCQRINVLVQGLVRPTTGFTDVNQRWNLPVLGQRLVRPTLEVPLAQTKTEGSLRYNNVLAPRYQSLYQYQPVSQVYPARQNLFSLLGLRPTQQIREQVMQQQLPTYLFNNDNIERNYLNVERNLVY